MSLSTFVDIFNIGKIFFFALCFIISETTASFNFMKQQLDNLFFYDCLCPKVICGDFAKKLVLAIVKHEAQH